MTDPESNNPGKQPDLGKAARDLWDATRAKAKELGGRAAEAAKDLQPKAQTPHGDTGTNTGQTTDTARSLKGKVADVWRRAPTLVIVCGIGLLALSSSCCICTGVLSLFSTTPRDQGSSSANRSNDTGSERVSVSESKGDPISGYKKDKQGYRWLRSWDETPPIIADWTKRGCIVYELQSWQNIMEAPEDRKTQYFVIDTDKLVKIYGKADRVLLPRPIDRPVWTEMSINKEPTDGGSISLHYIYQKDGKSIVYTTIMDGKSIYSKTVYTIKLHVDERSKEGYWNGTEVGDIKYRGRMANLPPQHKERKLDNGLGKAGTVIIHAP